MELSFAANMMTMAGPFFHILMFLSIMEYSSAADKISLAESISDGEKLISSSQIFELGFFSPGNSTFRFLGIWYKEIPEPAVWVANRNSPIADAKGVLTINDNGNLVLFDGINNTVWSSNVSRKAQVPVAQLLDSGNFVVIDNKTVKDNGSYLWQSFDYPSDTLLPGMKLGKNLKTGKEWFLTSWRSADDPSPGNFTARLSIQGLPSLVTYMGSGKVARTTPWEPSLPGTQASPSSIIGHIVVRSEDEIYYMYEPYNNLIIARFTVNQSGPIQGVIWNVRRSTVWEFMNIVPLDQCDQYGHCGANGICSIDKSPMCECLEGFRPESEGHDASTHGWSKRCVTNRPSDCQKAEGFVRLVSMKFPDFIDFKLNERMNLKECEVECLKNCSCSAYARASIDEKRKVCLMWFGDLIDMRNQSGQQDMGQDIYIKVPSLEQVPILTYTSKDKKRRTTTILLIVIPSMIVLVALFYYITKKIWKRGQKSCNKNVEVPLFDLASIATATNSFSEENLLGIGGFGPVYKGILPSGKEIAVKRLSKSSGQGAEEFRNEVDLIAKLQHKNLVALCGSCIQGEERLLIYEYMPNKSLDYFIFDHDRKVLLAWQKRFDIIMQIVRGILYLHQDSKLQIIHRDLKASNILLDSDMNAKISDFGLARTFEGDDKVSETKRVVGTFGYISPEYAVSGEFSAKSDVFSFGVVLLEIISGQKIRSFRHPDHHHSLSGHAWLLWNEDRAMELVDACLEDSIVESQVLRCIHVGLLCVQNFPEDRPTMSSVNFMLANEGAKLPHPKEPGFFTDSSSKANTAAVKEEANTVNMVTITMEGGR